MFKPARSAKGGTHDVVARSPDGPGREPGPDRRRRVGCADLGEIARLRTLRMERTRCGVVGLWPDLYQSRIRARPVHDPAGSQGRPDALPPRQLRVGLGEHEPREREVVQRAWQCFTAQEAGSPYTITTSDGRKIVMDRGLLRFQFDVHTKNDDDLDNDEFIDGTDELLADHGSHPRWHMSDDEYCALVNELLS